MSSASVIPIYSSATSAPRSESTSNGDWASHGGWDAHVKQTSPSWDAHAVRGAVTAVDGIAEQESEHCSPFKQSYYVDHDRNEAVLKMVDELVKGKFDEVIVYSFDSQSGKGLLDFLPHRARPNRLRSNTLPTNMA